MNLQVVCSYADTHITSVLPTSLVATDYSEMSAGVFVSQLQPCTFRCANTRHQLKMEHCVYVWFIRSEQKRGCRANTLARLWRQPNRPPLPSLFLMNVRSLFNKMDYQRLQVAMNNIVKDSCFLLITETWLNSFIPDSAIELAGFAAQRLVGAEDSDQTTLCVFSITTGVPTQQL